MLNLVPSHSVVFAVLLDPPTTSCPVAVNPRLHIVIVGLFLERCETELQLTGETVREGDND